MATTWTNQLKNGSTWLAGQIDITAGMDKYETPFGDLTVNAGGIGEITNWENQQRT